MRQDESHPPSAIDQFATAHALFVAGHFEQAALECAKLLELTPDHPAALNLKGNIEIGLQQFTEAAASLSQAITAEPDNPLHYLARGIALENLVHQDAASFDDVLAHFDKAIALDPQLVRSHYWRGRVLQLMQRDDEAAASYERALQLDPSHEFANYYLAAMGRIDKPETAPTQYVTTLFDDYASTFDDHLIQKLRYAAPAHLQQQFARHVAPGMYDILDLGCGTGLSGLVFQSLARTLDGVDLSSKMVAEAEKKSVYSTLSVDDITHHLEHSDQHYDLIVASDVFVYIGALDKIIELAAQRLKDTGYLAFTIEKSLTERFYLKPSRRYGHHLHYILDLAHQFNFGVVEIQNVVLRMERFHPLQGYAILLNKPEALTHIDLV